MPGRRPAAALLAALLALLVAGCGETEQVEQVRVLQLAPAIALPTAAGGGQREVALQAWLASAPASPARAARAAAAPAARATRGAAGAPVVQVPNVGSIAVDAPFGGRLINGLQLPARGLYWVTWDPILERSPSRPDRRWATDRMISFLMTVLRDYHVAHPGAPRVLVGDLSRPFGGPFGSDFGGLGHHSHQNGLDADIFYPRADHTERAPGGAQDVDRALAQDLVSRFVAYGAQFAFVGPNVGLGGPPAIVQVLAHHDEHVHVRIANTTSGARSETARR